MLSVVIDASGVMTVTGTDGADTIGVHGGIAPGVVVVRSSIDGDRGEYEGVVELRVDGGSGDDKIKVKGRLFAVDEGELPVTLIGGAGNDRIVGGDGGEHVLGGVGDDRIRGRGGDDMLDGSDGDDRIRAGAGNDLVIGGRGLDRLNGRRGLDRVSYERSPGGVEVDLGAGVASDDGYGDVDRRVLGFEELVGSTFADRLVGSRKTEVVLEGGGGADVLSRPVLRRGGAGTVVVGRVSDRNTVVRLVAVSEDEGIDHELDLTGSLNNDGGFVIDQGPIEALFGVSLKKGVTHALLLVAEDAAGNTTELSVPVTKGVGYELSFAGPERDVTDEQPVPGVPLPDGTFAVTATATDVAGNVSDPSDAEKVVVDTTGPSIETAVKYGPEEPVVDYDETVSSDPVIFGSGSFGSVNVRDLFSLVLKLSPDSDTGLKNNDRITNDTTPTVTTELSWFLLGVEIVIDISLDGIVIASLPSDVKTAWTLGPLADGDYTLQASARIVSTGELFKTSKELTITIDTVPPDPPSVHLAPVSDSGRSDSDGITNVVVPNFNLEGDADSFISLTTKRTGLVEEPGPPGTFSDPEPFDPESQKSVAVLTHLRPGTHPSGRGQSFDSGSYLFYNGWSRRHSFEDGIYDATAEATDLAGNVAVAPDTYQFTIDTTAPWAPIVDLTAGSDTGFSDTDNITADNTPSFSVIAQPDSDITVFVDGELFAEAGPTESDETIVTLGV